MIGLFREIYQSLQHGQELVLATIVSDSGSTPRTSGSRMIVYSDGSITGTVGGGVVEGDVIQRAVSLFKTGGAFLGEYDLQKGDSRKLMDVICGGRMQVLIEHLPASDENLALFRCVSDAMAETRSVSLVGKVVEKGGVYRVERGVQQGKEQLLGQLQISHQVFEVFEKVKSAKKTSLIVIEEQLYVVEHLQPPDTVYIVGGGHVSKEIAALTKQIGMRTLVFDDRLEFASSERFPEADEVHVCPGFVSVFDRFHLSGSSYIVIATRGHHLDKEVLAQALQTGAGYIGMIGSRRKRNTIYQDLIREGVKETTLEQVCCPIGLSIGAETPAEIGVSVVAQLIQHRSNQIKHA